MRTAEVIGLVCANLTPQPRSERRSRVVPRKALDGRPADLDVLIT
ncbi:hypothetical protein ACF1BQ_029965 [Bradyrhizobium sp. RDT10]